MKYLLKHPILSITCRWILGGVFVYASLDKIQNPGAFAWAIGNYQLLPIAWIEWVAHILPWLELLGGIALMIGFGTMGAAIIIAGLLLIFIAAIGLALMKGIDITCGCFTLSDEGRRISVQTLLADIGLLAMAVQIMYGARSLPVSPLLSVDRYWALRKKKI